MTRLSIRHGAVNLAQGFPDFPAPKELKEAAREAIAGDYNQYAITWGARPLREAIAKKYAATYGLVLDPEREITVVCGSTEGMIATLLATTNPGDEVIIFEPFYENYGPDTDLCSARRVYVPLHPPGWNFDPQELRRAFSPRTKAIIVNSPHNPTGKVFTPSELSQIAALCQEFDCLCFTDEIYEHITYGDARHIPMATLPGMQERTVLVNSMSKTYSVTGWRVGWVAAPPALTDSIRKVHDFLTVGAAAPLQQAGAAALSLPPSYYEDLRRNYSERRDLLLSLLAEAGLPGLPPSGAYYVLCDVSPRGFAIDIEACRFLIETAGVAAVPGFSFLQPGSPWKSYIRFCFCKKYETLKEAGARLKTAVWPAK